jgi:hypothetical protein
VAKRRLTPTLDVMEEAGCSTPVLCVLARSCSRWPFNPAQGACGAAEAATQALEAHSNELARRILDRIQDDNPPTNAAMASELGISCRQASKLRKAKGATPHADMRDSAVAGEVRRTMIAMIQGGDV